MKTVRHPLLRGAFWVVVTLVASVFVFAPLALMALSAVFAIVPAIPFLIVPFLKGSWQGPAEPERARFRVVDVTTHHTATALPAHA